MTAGNGRDLVSDAPGRQNAEETSCAPILQTLSHSMYFLVLRRLIIFFRCSETRFVRHTDVKVGFHGPQAVTHLGPPKGAHGALGRCVSSYAGTYSLITVNKPLSSDLMIHLSSLSVPEEP